jgi:hypothetical protein
VHSSDYRARTGIPANRSDGSLRRAPSLWPDLNSPTTDFGAPVPVAGGAVETYPAGLAVVYLAKLSLPQHCLSSQGRSGVSLASKTHRLRVMAYLLARLSSRRLWPAPMTAPLAAFPPIAPIAAPFAAPLALGWELCFCCVCVAAGGVCAGGVCGSATTPESATRREITLAGCFIMASFLVLSSDPLSGSIGGHDSYYW